MIAAPAWAQADRPLHLSAASALLLAPDGTVLFAKNPSEDHAPASLVKLMTLYLACEDLEAGKVHAPARRSLSARFWKASPSPRPMTRRRRWPSTWEAARRFSSIA